MPSAIKPSARATTITAITKTTKPHSRFVRRRIAYALNCRRKKTALKINNAPG